MKPVAYYFFGYVSVYSGSIYDAFPLFIQGVSLLRSSGMVRLSLTQSMPKCTVSNSSKTPLTNQESLQLVPVRKQSTEPAPQQSDAETKPRPYSPFQVSTSNKAEFALARVDDLVNWARKVNMLTKIEQCIMEFQDF